MTWRGKDCPAARRVMDAAPAHHVDAVFLAYLQTAFSGILTGAVVQY